MVLVAVTPEDCEFYTPQYILDKVYKVFSVDLDPCSPVNNPVVQAKQHYTIEDDGLSKEWHGNISLNPPYGRFIIKWVEKFLRELRSHNIESAILLVPMKCDARWFNILADECYAMLTLRGRLPFTSPHGLAKRGTFGSCLFLFTEDPDVVKSFVNEFSEYGLLWGRIRWLAL